MTKKYTIKPSPKKSKKSLDEEAIKTIRELNRLILNAHAAQLPTIKNILSDARESIAWWATHENYNESDAEKLKYHLTLESGMYIALEFVAKFTAIKDERIKADLLHAMGQFRADKIASYPKMVMNADSKVA